MRYWVQEGGDSVDFNMATSKLPFRYAAVDEALTLAYQDNLPSRPYWQWMEARGGNVVWTD